MNDKITEKLFELRDEEYAKFQSRIVSNIPAETIIGVRTPVLRSLAKQLVKEKETEEFLNDLPHKYFDQNQLHIFIVSAQKDFELCMEQTEKFLPYVDNWATCDQLAPAVFKKHRAELMEKIKVWIKSERPYTVRFAVEMLMSHFLDEDFLPEYLDMVATVKSDEYYVNMMCAWYFATALAKHYEAALPYITEGRLCDEVHNRTIKKARESLRITKEQKDFLNTFKR